MAEKFSEDAKKIIRRIGDPVPRIARMVEAEAKRVKSLSKDCNEFALDAGKDFGMYFKELSNKLRDATEKKVITDKEFDKAQGESYSIMASTLSKGAKNLRKCMLGE